MYSRDYHLRCFKRTESNDDWVNYKCLCNSVNNKVRVEKANHIRNTLHDSSDTPSTYWSHIKKCYQTKNTKGPSKTAINIIGTPVTSKSKIENSFYNFFTTVGSSQMRSDFINNTLPMK